MKQIYIIIAALLVVFTYNSESQLLQKYKAKDAVSAARTEASSVAGNPVLTGLGTFAGQLEGVPITLEFDETNGTATVWIYIFRSTSPDTLVTYAMTKILGFYTPIPIDLSSLDIQLPFTPETSLDSKTWIDSDQMMKAIQANDEYKSYKASNQDAKLQMAGLGNEPLNNTPTWGVMFTSEAGNMNCIVDAETSEVTCIDLTGIEENTTNIKLDIYPNPASDMAFLTLPINHINSSGLLNIYDLQGNLVKSANNLDVNSDGRVAINVTSMSTGTYSVMYQANGQIFVSRLIVIR